MKIKWPNGMETVAYPGDNWLKLAKEAGIKVPTGCMGGSCGVCEIEVNGETTRICINNVPKTSAEELKVSLITDPYW